MAKLVDLTGQRFGKLLVLRMNIRKVDIYGKKLEATYHCRCDCGKECDVSARILRTGNRKTCGCKIGAKKVSLLSNEPVFKDGFAECLHPTNCCKYSVMGRCCHSCSWFEKCDNRCLNTPERCAT